MSNLRTIPIPLPGSRWAAIQAPFPLSREAWDHMLTVLDAMKPGLVQDPPPDPEEDANDEPSH